MTICKLTCLGGIVVLFHPCRILRLVAHSLLCRILGHLVRNLPWSAYKWKSCFNYQFIIFYPTPSRFSYSYNNTSFFSELWDSWRVTSERSADVFWLIACRFLNTPIESLHIIRSCTYLFFISFIKLLLKRWILGTKYECLLLSSSDTKWINTHIHCYRNWATFWHMGNWHLMAHQTAQQWYIQK